MLDVSMFMSYNLYGFSVKTVVYMLFNFLSSVTIILANKYVFRDYAYSYATMLTVIHFVFTFAGLHMLARAGHFQVRKVDIAQVMPLVLAFCGFVVFNNLSLQYNSVGCYQLMKVMTTPVIAVVQWWAYGVKLDDKLKAALVPICIGVALATVNDMELTFMGLMYGVLGLVSTSFYQIWVKVKQDALGLNSYQLLYYQAPLSAVVVLLTVPVFDTVSGPTGLFEYVYTGGAVFWISVTGVLAFCVNLSIYLVIGNTSPISYNVLGHFKLCVILFSGWLFFAEDMNSKKFLGTVMAFAGVVLYTHLKQNIGNEWGKQKQADKPPASIANDAGPTTSGVGAPESVALLSGTGAGAGTGTGAGTAPGTSGAGNTTAAGNTAAASTSASASAAASGPSGPVEAAARAEGSVAVDVQPVKA